MCCRSRVCTEAGSCLRQVPIFECLTEEEAGELQEVTSTKVFARGEPVFREGEKSDSLYVLSSGLVKVRKIADTGKEHIMRFLFPGDFFGQFALLQNKRHYADAEAIEESVVCRVGRAQLESVMERNPAMTRRFLLALSERLHQAEEWAGALSLLEVERRLARMLLHFRERGGGLKGTILLPAAKKEVAMMIGTTPETLSRKLNQFEEQRLIRVERRVVDVLDADRLAELAGAVI